MTKRQSETQPATKTVAEVRTRRAVRGMVASIGSIAARGIAPGTRATRSARTEIAGYGLASSERGLGKCGYYGRSG